MASKTASNIKYRGGIFSRILAAIVGGYIFTNVFSILLFYALSYSGTIQVVLESAMTAVVCALVIYTLCALWIFHTKTALRAWLGMLIPSIIGGIGVYFLLPEGLF